MTESEPPKQQFRHQLINNYFSEGRASDYIEQKISDKGIIIVCDEEDEAHNSPHFKQLDVLRL